MVSPDYARWFKDIRARDIASVGGKNASLGEMYSTLSPQGYGRRSQPASIRDVLVRFHHVSASGRYSQP